MALAGYNPDQAVFFWERMSAKAGGQAPPVSTSRSITEEKASVYVTT
jgi:hypothetical protein